MKTISIILPINNPEILNQEDLQNYQTKDCYFQLSYANTKLKELNTSEDVMEVIPLVLERIKEAENYGSSAVVIYGFGDVAIKEGKNLVSIPVMGLGKPAAHMASRVCRHFYTNSSGTTQS